MNELIDDIVYKTFGCAVDQGSFSQHYAAMPKEHERINRVTLRIWMAFQLRYRFTYEPNYSLARRDWSHVAYREIPSLEIYLLITCLDTLAAKHNRHLDFDDWLDEQVLPETLDKTAVRQLYNDWKDIYGVTKAQKALFDNLPQSLTDWLTRNIVFHKFKGTATINRKLHKYLFEKWRNSFTHSSTTDNATPADIELPSDNDKWWSYSPDGYLDYRVGLDVATIIRVIVYAVVLDRLGIEVSASRLDSYVKSLSKLDAFYKFKWELAHNVRTLRSWSAYDGSIMAIRPLSSEQANRLMEKTKISPIRMERKLAETIAQFLPAIGRINARIDIFNAEHPREPVEALEAYRDALKRFLSNQVEAEEYQAILEIPRQSEVTSIDISIREIFVY